jgi:hypothetical protein
MTDSTRKCPVCYNNLTIDNIVNLQCCHALCKGCFKSWVDDGGKNSCPECRADVLKSSAQKLRFQKKISDYEYEVHILENEINDHDVTINNQLDCNSSLKKQKKKLVEYIQRQHAEILRVEHNVKKWEHRYDKLQTKDEKIYNSWLKKPILAITHWENKKRKLENGQEKKTRNLKKICEIELKKIFDDVSWRKHVKPSIICNQIIANNIEKKFKQKYEESKLIDLSESIDIFQNDTSNYKVVEGIELRLLCKYAILKNKCVCENCERRKKDGCTFETECMCEICFPIPELTSNSETETDDGGDEMLNTGLTNRPSSETETDDEEDYSNEHIIPDNNWDGYRSIARSVNRNLTHELNMSAIQNATTTMTEWFRGREGEVNDLEYVRARI